MPDTKRNLQSNEAVSAVGGSQEALAITPAPQSLEGMIQRKKDHIDHVLTQRAEGLPLSDFDSIRLPHDALPDVDFEGGIDLSTRFLGRQLQRPFLISSMTGGPEKAEEINTHLAEAANVLGLAMGVGSQRVALFGKDPNLGKAGLEGRIRKLIGSQPLFANLGAVQLLEGDGVSMARRAVDSLEADALILHLNPMQEIMQDGGDINWRGVAAKMEQLIGVIGVPVIAKEVGFGLSAAVAFRLQDMGVAALDVAGKGGTNFGLVEGVRSTDPDKTELSNLFADWGLTTVEALREIKANPAISLPLIASGGIRHGLDGAKSIALGATLIGQAGPVLAAALQSTDAVLAHFAAMESALKTALFGTGSANLADFQTRCGLL